MLRDTAGRSSNRDQHPRLYGVLGLLSDVAALRVAPAVAPLSGQRSVSPMSRLLVFADLGQIVIRVRSTARVTLAAGLGLLVLVTAPQAAFGTVNLVQNAGAEDGPSGGGN